MLKVVLAGLVLNGVLTIQQAKIVEKKLSNRKVPKTLEQTVMELQKTIEETKKK